MIMLAIAFLILMSIIGGVLYRMGGASGFNTKFRDFGIPGVGILVLLVLGNRCHVNGWSILNYVLTWGFMFAAQTTYFKKKGKDAKWWNWFLVGLANGLALIPYAWQTGLWMDALLRTVILAIAITIWSEVCGDAVWEEVGRGVLIILTLGLFLIVKRKKPLPKV